MPIFPTSAQDSAEDPPATVHTVSRRQFMRAVSMGGVAVAWGGQSPMELAAPAADVATGTPTASLATSALRMAPEATPTGLTLVAKEGTANIGAGVQANAWMLNGSLPSPLIRVRRGERFQVSLENELDDDLILHWHGLTPPDHSDGHPRFAVGTGESYEYDFTVEDRAGTYWYHSHTHQKVGEHSYRGIGGMILIGDDEEDRLGLPSGAREVPLILQDRKLDAKGRPIFELRGGHLLDGYMGPEPFGNGIHRPFLEVDSGLYRFRVLNGSNARIFDLELSDGRPMTLIGTDGGLLREAVSLTSIELAPAERADLLVDFRGLNTGDTVTLRSRAFVIESEVPQTDLQGEALDLLELRVTNEVEEPPFELPARLSEPTLPDPALATRERIFTLTSDRDPVSRSMMTHQINGRDFQMGVIDEKVPFGDTEVWKLVNESDFAHPIHIHATHFHVVSREGGRGRLMPWEAGLKDTVLLHPYETVRIAIRFTSHRGLYLIHCHNLEHEDVGMMLNVQVE